MAAPAQKLTSKRAAVRKRPPSTASLLRRRARLLGPNFPTFYEEPVHIVRGEGVWLYDAAGKRYLDVYNNVPHVGHCHPAVVEAISRQAATLNTHTRYLHEAILDYVEQLTATFAAPLQTGLLTCTGSEANDVALRMAEAATGRRGIIVTDHTYHGNTAAVSQLSTIFAPFEGYGPHIRQVPVPDSYRPPGGRRGAKLAAAYASAVQEQIKSLEAAGIGLAAFVFCPIFANEGFPVLPTGYLQQVIAHVRAAGGLVIADEVQAGFGRPGTHMWGHGAQGFTPDIVTLGKPMGNGHPIGGVVTTRDIMKSFRRKAMYFNTFGGNPVACAAAQAVLDVIEQEDLIENARDVGAYSLRRLRRLRRHHEIIGDVRGTGLFFGAELVRDRKTKEPAGDEAGRLVNLMRDRGVLMGRIGRYGNILKIRPPMPFSRANADLLLDALDDVLARL